MPQIMIDQAIQIAYQHHQAGRLAEAEKIYRQILAQQPAHVDALRLLGALAGQAGQWQAAAALLRQAIQLRPDDAEAHFNLGLALMQSGQLDQAADACRQAVRLNPDYAEAYNNLGILLNDLGQPEQAVAAYRRAIELKPDFTAAHNNLGLALNKLGRLEEAVAAFESAIRLKTDSAEAHSNLGIVLNKLGRSDAAIAAHRQAIRLKPDYAEAHHNLGLTFFGAGKFDEAGKAYRQALALRPTYPGAFNDLMSELAAVGQFDQVMEEYRRTTMPSGAAQDSVSTPPAARLPYIGDRIILLTCPRPLREPLRSLGLCDYKPETSEAIAVSDPAQRAAAIRAHLDVVGRNQAAMSAAICTIWMDDVPPDIAPAIREAAGTDRLEITAETIADLARQIEPNAKPRPDMAGKVFAICSIRNGPLDLLPHWLDHYTKLGADELLLGVFDDLSPTRRDEIARCADRWRFTCFSQTWHEIPETLQTRQRRSGCRLAGAVPQTWILHTDVDELHEFPAPLHEIIAAAEAKEIPAVIGWFLDRATADGSMPAVRPSPTLWQQFPIGCRLTARVMRTVTQKIMLARFAVPVHNGHHFTEGRVQLGGVPIGRADQYIVHHFKWHGDLLARMEWSLSQPNTQPEWKADANRFLNWFNANGGRINIDDPVIEARTAPPR